MASYVKVANEGDVAPGRVTCVRTGNRRIALFNEDGTALTPPAGGNLRRYPVCVDAGAIEVEIGD